MKAELAEGEVVERKTIDSLFEKAASKALDYKNAYCNFDLS